MPEYTESEKAYIELDEEFLESDIYLFLSDVSKMFKTEVPTSLYEEFKSMWLAQGKPNLKDLDCSGKSIPQRFKINLT